MSKTNSRGCEQIIEVIVNMQKNGGGGQVWGGVDVNKELNLLCKYEKNRGRSGGGGVVVNQ